MPKEVKVISLFMGGWFLSMFFYEVSNLFSKEEILYVPSEMYLWIKWALCFFLGVTGIIVNELIKKWN
jgi:hypothetical protein